MSDLINKLNSFSSAHADNLHRDMKIDAEFFNEDLSLTKGGIEHLADVLKRSKKSVGQLPKVEGKWLLDGDSNEQ